MRTERHLPRVGGVAAIGGALTLFTATLLHPLDADPNDPAAAFAEYAADSLWIASHLGNSRESRSWRWRLWRWRRRWRPGRASAWARIGVLGTAASVAAAAALQAVDGVALNVGSLRDPTSQRWLGSPPIRRTALVDRWARASGEARARAFEGAFAVRQIEIGLASLLSILFGLTISAFGMSMLVSRRFPTWLGWLGLVGGLGTVAAGIALAYTGFSARATTRCPQALSCSSGRSSSVRACGGWILGSRLGSVREPELPRRTWRNSKRCGAKIAPDFSPMRRSHVGADLKVGPYE